ncbi:MAG: NAD(P)H-quinone oxidoreductase [Rickettsiales endosymbiont of Dermacentor nuttalli]
MQQTYSQYIIENKKIVHTEIEIPFPSGNDVLIKVWAAGVNRADLLQVQGLYRAPKDYENLPGLEIAGEVVAIGPAVTNFKIGDKVCSLLSGGGYSEYTILNQDILLHIPSNLSYVEAAALPESIYSFYLNFLWQTPLFKPHDKLLITGGASGISTLTIQLAKAYGMQVCTLVSSKKKQAFCQNLKADLVINYKIDDFVNVLKSVNFYPDLIFDMYGGEFIEKYLHILNHTGKILLIGVMNNSITSFSLGRLLMKNASIIAKTLRSQSLQTKIEITKEIIHEMWPLIQANKIKPYIYKVFPFTQIEEAHNLMKSNQHLGKIVLSDIISS